MNPSFEIQGRKVGIDYDPLVVGEIGINHGGSLWEAFKIVDAAAQAGLEIIKHQTHVVSDEMSSEARNVIPGHTKESIYDIINGSALGEKDELELKEYVEAKGMIFFSTPFSRAAADRLQKMGVHAYKVGSGECNNYPLLKHIASFGKPIILSTGMNTMESIRRAVEVFEEHGVKYALLHCTNVYPTPPHLVRLGAITQLQREFPNAVIGLSDHTTTNYPCLGAVALGASILERHFTDTMMRPGPDIVCSMGPDAARELVAASKIMKQARGGEKGPVAEEKPTIDFAFACVCSTREIRAGEVFSRENVWVKRPGTGEIKAIDYEGILGRKAKVNIAKDVQLRRDQIE